MGRLAGFHAGAEVDGKRKGGGLPLVCFFRCLAFVALYQVPVMG